MKSFSKLVSEVAQPKPEDEIQFKAKHVVSAYDHPIEDDAERKQFKGGTKKTPKRRADYKEKEDVDVYEAMDPVNKKAAMKSFKDRKDKDIDNDGDVDSSDRYLHNRRKAITKAMKKPNMKEQAELEEMKLSAIMRKINDGKWEAMTDVKKGKHVEVRDTETGKRKMIMVEKAESKAQAIAARIALKHKREGTKPKAGTASAEMIKMSEKDLKDFTKMKKGAPYKVEEETNVSKMKDRDLEMRINTLKRQRNRVSNPKAKDQLRQEIKTLENEQKRRVSKSLGLGEETKNIAEDAWEEIPMMSRQLQFMMYAAQEIMSYLNDCDEMCVDPEEWFQNKLAHVHGQMRTLHAYVEGDRRMNMMNMYGEQAEELDEVTRSAIKRPVKYTDARGVTRTRMTTTRPVRHDQYGQEKMRESLEEAVKPGKIKLDNGERVTVSKEDAEVLNRMMDELSSQNREKMQKMMMKNQDGFKKILSFAKEAL